MRAFLAIAAVMQLAACIAYGLGGLGLIFVLLELFTVFAGAVTVLELIWRHKGPQRSPWVHVNGRRWW